MEKLAAISVCQRYRTSLSRHWDRSRGYVLFVGLNPSTADAEKDDPTIRRCIRFAKDWGYGGIEMANLFDWRSTDPKLIPKHPFAVSETNDLVIKIRAVVAKVVIAAWGNVPWAEKRIEDVFKNCFSEEKRWHCLGRTKSGMPRHPLYMPASATPVLFW